MGRVSSTSRRIKRIGICDSGIGGLSILHGLLPLGIEEYIYVGDTAHVPYGDKAVHEIEKLSINLIKFLVEKECDAIVIACHTICATALSIIKKTFPDILFFEIIDGTIEQAVAYTKNNSIGLIGTTATIESGLYRKKIHDQNREIRIVEKASPSLVPLIEKSSWDIEDIRYELKRSLSPLIIRNVDTIILGCTHYILIQNLIREFLPTGIQLVNAQQQTRRSVQQTLGDKFSPIDVPQISLYLTGNSQKFVNPYEPIIATTKVKQIHL